MCCRLDGRKEAGRGRVGLAVGRAKGSAAVKRARFGPHIQLSWEVLSAAAITKVGETQWPGCAWRGDGMPKERKNGLGRGRPKSLRAHDAKLNVGRDQQIRNVVAFRITAAWMPAAFCTAPSQSPESPEPRAPPTAPQSRVARRRWLRASISTHCNARGPGSDGSPTASPLRCALRCAAEV